MKKKRHIKSSSKSYGEFLADLKLVYLSLTSSSSQLDRSAYFQLLEQKKNAVRNMTANFRLDEADDHFFEAIMKFNLTVQDKEAKITALAIECVFEAHFHTKRSVDKHFAERFTSSELRLIAWPYFRQFVSDTSARMAIPPVIIPLATKP